LWCGLLNAGGSISQGVGGDMAEFPKQAKVVIVGLGGIVGSAIAHHLIELGWDDIVGLDKSAIPTDIGSTSHASDFCYTTGADKFTAYTTRYSQQFFESRGNYVRCGGLEVARVDDDARMLELKRKIGQGKAFGSRVSLISPAEAKAKFPLLAEDQIQGALWVESLSQYACAEDCGGRGSRDRGRNSARVYSVGESGFVGWDLGAVACRSGWVKIALDAAGTSPIVFWAL
jgi:hypothetical protein